MNRVVAAVESHKCVLAIAGALTQDPDVLLALKDRKGLPAIALSGPARQPLLSIGANSIARAIAEPGGVVVLIEPQSVDGMGMKALAKQLSNAVNKPSVFVVSKAFNPFQFQAAFPGLSVGHIKGRGKVFVRGLPVPAAMEEGEGAVAAPLVKKVKSGDPNAPRFCFAGREEELPALVETLSTGGPVVVSGGRGSGRSWLIHHAIEKAELHQHPDLTLGRGAGFDALVGRLAAITAAGGSNLLMDDLKGKRTPESTIQATLAALAAAEGTDGQVMIVAESQVAMGREGSFFRKDRLAMLVRALMTHTYPLRLIFVSVLQPVFYEHGANESLRRVEVEGLKGRVLHEVFAAYKAPEFSRDKFGPISERLHGHPMAARQLAIESRERDNGLVLLDDAKFMKMESTSDTKPLQKVLSKRVEKLKGDKRDVLALIAHVRVPVSGQFLADLGIKRASRLSLLAAGLLDMVGTENNRMYRIHPLVRSTFRMREISDFDCFAKVKGLAARMRNQTQGVEKLAWSQLHNRCAVGCRKDREMLSLDVPDHDPLIDAITGLLRSQKPNFKVAYILLEKVLNQNPSNSDAHQLRIEFLHATESDNATIEAAFEEAFDYASVPELYHQAAGWYLSKRSRTKAIAVLERAVATLPDEVRLKTRLGALMMRQGRRPEAIAMLQAAMDFAPMLPDAYGLLGMARAEEGQDSLEDAESLLREAVRLAPEDPVQVPRLAILLMARARVEPDNAAALREEAIQLLDTVTRGSSKCAEGFLQLAIVMREDGRDLERCAWLLNQARKSSDRRSERSTRIRLERALVGVMRGDLDTSETTIREMAQRDMSNPRVFVALARVLEARQLFIPAHAELLRAVERTSQHSLERLTIEANLARLQAIIEAQAAGTYQPPPEVVKPAAPPVIADHNRVIRRRKKGSEDEDEAAEGAKDTELAAEGQGEAIAEAEDAAAAEAVVEAEAAEAVEEPEQAPVVEAAAESEVVEELAEEAVVEAAAEPVVEAEASEAVEEPEEAPVVEAAAEAEVVEELAEEAVVEAAAEPVVESEAVETVEEPEEAPVVEAAAEAEVVEEASAEDTVQEPATADDEAEESVEESGDSGQ